MSYNIALKSPRTTSDIIRATSSTSAITTTTISSMLQSVWATPIPCWAGGAIWAYYLQLKLRLSFTTQFNIHLIKMNHYTWKIPKSQLNLAMKLLAVEFVWFLMQTCTEHQGGRESSGLKMSLSPFSSRLRRSLVGSAAKTLFRVRLPYR